MKKVLEKSKNNMWLIRLKTKHPDSDEFDGIVLHYNNTNLVFCLYDNFEFESIMILPRKWISGYRDSEFEICTNEIIRFNKQIENIPGLGWLKEVNSIRDILIKIKEQNIWPIIEAIHDDDSALYIGPITNVKSNSVEIDCYDATGEWEDLYDVRFSEIFKIEIFDKYSKHFNAFMIGTSN